MSKHYTVYVIKRTVEDWESSSTSLETGHLTHEEAEREVRRLEAHDLAFNDTLGPRQKHRRRDARYEIESIEVYP